MRWLLSSPLKDRKKKRKAMFSTIRGGGGGKTVGLNEESEGRGGLLTGSRETSAGSICYIESDEKRPK